MHNKSVERRYINKIHIQIILQTLRCKPTRMGPITLSMFDKQKLFEADNHNYFDLNICVISHKCQVKSDVAILFLSVS